MKITILCVGKIKEKFYRDAIAEYSKRLSRYCKLDIIEVADEKTPENASDTVENQIREKEAERILMRLDKEAKEGAYVFALAIDGREFDSVELSKKIENLGTSGISQRKAAEGEERHESTKSSCPRFLSGSKYLQCKRQILSCLQFI